MAQVPQGPVPGGEGVHGGVGEVAEGDAAGHEGVHLGLGQVRAAAAVLGVKRLALADLAVVERRTGYVRGGVSPLGQRRPHPVVLDSSALDAELMYVSGGQRGLDVEIAPADLVRVTGAVVAEIAAG